MKRRDFITTAGAGALILAGIRPISAQSTTHTMHGLIGKMKAVAGQRDALISILLDGISEMPGCLSYVVARDPKDADALWITEVWDSEASHKASLQLPAVKDAIARGRPLIAEFSEYHVTSPIGGHGLKS